MPYVASQKNDLKAMAWQQRTAGGISGGMKTRAIEVHAAGEKRCDCCAVVVVPDEALSEPGQIRTFSTSGGAQAKHEFYAMAQTAYFQLQDEELEITEVGFPITVVLGDPMSEISSGLVVCRRASGGLEALIHSKQSPGKLLEAAHRYCTRWVRLDI